MAFFHRIPAALSPSWAIIYSFVFLRAAASSFLCPRATSARAFPVRARRPQPIPAEEGGPGRGEAAGGRASTKVRYRGEIIPVNDCPDNYSAAPEMGSRRFILPSTPFIGIETPPPAPPNQSHPHLFTINLFSRDCATSRTCELKLRRASAGVDRKALISGSRRSGPRDKRRAGGKHSNKAIRSHQRRERRRARANDEQSP